jgi:hypothetical protein
MGLSLQNVKKLLTVTLKVSLEQVPPAVPGAAIASSLPEGPRRVKDSKSSRKKQTSGILGKVRFKDLKLG